MNIFKKIYTKWIITKHFNEVYVKTGLVSDNFKVCWDSKKNDFYVEYTPVCKDKKLNYDIND